MVKALQLAVATAAMMVAVPAVAQDDFNGATQILRGDYASAEKVILQQQRMFPQDADLLLNLARVYSLTGRTSEARATYRAVLARPDDMMDLSNAAGPRSSHAIAGAALQRLDGYQMTSR